MVPSSLNAGSTMETLSVACLGPVLPAAVTGAPPPLAAASPSWASMTADIIGGASSLAGPGLPKRTVGSPPSMRIGRTLGELVRRVAASRGVHLARRRDYQLIPRNYYSPIPDYQALPGDIWDRRTALRGIAFDTEEQMGWAERELGDYVRELEAPRTGDFTGKRFFFENKTYEYGDAEIAYAMVRRLRPANILE